ncbi:MAG: hypothetical protein SO253_00550 [Bacilli bacterium]|nr:hypothetical protein [Bacilli bacterium]
MDITILKKLIKQNKLIIGMILFFLILNLVFVFILKNNDTKTALALINTDLLERSIDEETYIIDEKLVFDKNKVQYNLQQLFELNNINVNYQVSVDKEKIKIVINGQTKSFAICRYDDN